KLNKLKGRCLMPLKQNSLFYDLSVYLVEQQDYNVLYFNVRENEIWLSKNINKVENIIRIVNKRFDWKNRLKSDIAKVYQRVQSLKKNYLIYDLYNYLVKQQDNNILYFNVRENEIWLSKNINKVENIIRIVNKRFDWKNRLKSDIAKVFQRVQSLKKHFTLKTINI